jgi:hypothetical protein
VVIYQLQAVTAYKAANMLLKYEKALTLAVKFTAKSGTSK